MHAMTMYCCYYSCKFRFMQNSCLLLVKKTDNWYDFKCVLHLYIKHARSTIMSTTNFSTLFLKLQKELPIENTKKKLDPHTKITPIARQKNLLMYASFKDYNNPLEFSTFEDCNEFVDKWVIRCQDFKFKHGADPINGKFFFFSIHYGISIRIIYWNCKWNYNHIFFSHLTNVYILVYHICKSIFDSYGNYESWW